MWQAPGAYLLERAKAVGSRTGIGGFGAALSGAHDAVSAARATVEEQAATMPELRSDSKLLEALRVLSVHEPATDTLLDHLLRTTESEWSSARVARVAHTLLRRCAASIHSASSASTTPDGERGASLHRHRHSILRAVRVWQRAVERRHTAREVLAVRSAAALALESQLPEVVDATLCLLESALVSVLGAQLREGAQTVARAGDKDGGGRVTGSSLRDEGVLKRIDAAAALALQKVWRTDAWGTLAQSAAAAGRASSSSSSTANVLDADDSGSLARTTSGTESDAAGRAGSTDSMRNASMAFPVDVGDVWRVDNDDGGGAAAAASAAAATSAASDAARSATSLADRQALISAVLLAVRQLNDVVVPVMGAAPVPLPPHLLELSLSSSVPVIRRHACAITLQMAQFAHDSRYEYTLPTGLRTSVRRAMGSRPLLQQLVLDVSAQVYFVQLLGVLLPAAPGGTAADVMPLRDTWPSLQLSASDDSALSSLLKADAKRQRKKQEKAAREGGGGRFRFSPLFGGSGGSSRDEKRGSAGAAVTSPATMLNDLSSDERELTRTELLVFVRRVCASTSGNRVMLEVLAQLSRTLAWDEWAYTEIDDTSWHFTREEQLDKFEMIGSEAQALVELDELAAATGATAGAEQRSGNGGSDIASDDTVGDADQDSLERRQQRQQRATTPMSATRSLIDVALRRVRYSLESVEPVRRLAALILLLQVVRHAAMAPPPDVDWLVEQAIFTSVYARVRRAALRDALLVVRSKAATAMVYIFFIRDRASAGPGTSRMAVAAGARYADLFDTLTPFVDGCSPREATNFLREGTFGYARATPVLAKLHVLTCERFAERFDRSPSVLSWLRSAWYVVATAHADPGALRDVLASLTRALDHSTAWITLAAAAFSRRFGVDVAVNACASASESEDASAWQARFARLMDDLLASLWGAVTSSNAATVRSECLLAYATAAALADEPFLAQALDALGTVFQRPGLGLASVAKVAFDALNEIVNARRAAAALNQNQRQARSKCAARASSVVIALSGLSKPPKYYRALGA